MKKYFVLFAIISIASLFTASCVESANEETENLMSVLPEAGEIVFHTSFAEPQTKASYVGDDDTGLYVNWEPLDKLSVFYRGEQGEQPFLTQNSVSSASADIVGSLSKTGTENDFYYYAIYPHRATTSTGGNYYESGEHPVLRTWLTTSQKNAQENNVSTGVLLHAGRTADKDQPFIMYNLCALFRFKITQSEDVRRITFKGRNNELISGPVEFYFDNNGVPTGIKKDTYVSSGSKSVILSKTGNIPFSKETWYYIVMIPTQFTKGATVTLETSTSKVTRTILTDGFSLGRNECLGSSKLDNNLDYVPAITAKLKMNNMEVSETTLWPKGTTTLSLLSLKGPLDNTLSLSDLGLTESNLIWTSSNNNVATVSNGFVTGVAAGEATITVKGIEGDKEWFSASCVITVTEAASQLVAKPFIVDENGTTVNFAAGNLYTPDGGTTYAVHSFQGQVYSTEENWSVDGQRDLLQWSEIATREPDTADGTDIPTVFNSVWRALTFDQWEYIINTRTANTLNSVENARYAKATVNGISGLLLFPDEYEHPSDVSLPNKKSINKTNCAFSLNYYSETAWEKLEKAGVVFLPLGGHLTGSTWNYDGRYWSCSTRNFERKTGGRLQVSDDLCRVTSNAKTDYMSVRLVRFVTE